MVIEFWKSVNICKSYGKQSTSSVLFFDSRGIYAYTLWRRTTKFDVADREGRASWGQPRLPSQENGVPGLPNFGVLLYLRLHRLTQNDQIRHGNTYGEGLFFRGQPRHCICTNALRALSVSAEFLVDVDVQRLNKFRRTKGVLMILSSSEAQHRCCSVENASVILGAL